MSILMTFSTPPDALIPAYLTIRREFGHAAFKPAESL
jgi:hypothetical protein